MVNIHVSGIIDVDNITFVIRPSYFLINLARVILFKINQQSIMEEKEEDKRGEITTERLVMALQFFKDLSELDEDALFDHIYQNSDLYQVFFSEIGAFISRSCGNLNKLYEMIAALRIAKKYPPDQYSVHHIKNGYGADIIITNKETEEEIGIEIKTSVVKKNKQYHASWNFTVCGILVDQYKSATSEDEKKKAFNALCESIYRKQSGGVILMAFENSTLLNEYDINGAFMTLYCVKKALSCSKCNEYEKKCIHYVKIKEIKMNIGCDRCTVSNCNEYHRILHILKFSNRMEQMVEVYGEFVFSMDNFDNNQWNEIMERIPSKCTVKK